MPHQYSSFHVYILCSAGISSEIGEWRAVSFTRAILLTLHCSSLFSLPLVYLEAQQISFHALLDIATSPDSPLRLTLISIIAICFMRAPFCNGGLHFHFHLFFCLKFYLAFPFEDCTIKKVRKALFGSSKIISATIIPVASHR